VTIRNRKIVHWRDYLDPLRVFAALEVPGTTEQPA
jgi:limonene-1,2-epoxide hydrolase